MGFSVLSEREGGSARTVANGIARAPVFTSYHHSVAQSCGGNERDLTTACMKAAAEERVDVLLLEALDYVFGNGSSCPLRLNS